MRNVIKICTFPTCHLLYGQLRIICLIHSVFFVSIKMMHKTIIWLTRFFSVHRPSHPEAFRFNEYGIMSQAIMMRNVLGVCSGSLIIGFVSPIQTASAPLFTNWLKWMQQRNNKNSCDAAQKWNEVCVTSVFSLSTVKLNNMRKWCSVLFCPS